MTDLMSSPPWQPSTEDPNDIIDHLVEEVKEAMMLAEYEVIVLVLLDIIL